LSVRLLNGRIAARRTHDPFIVMGDFNMETDNPAMADLQNLGNRTPYPQLMDAWSSVHFREPQIGTRHGWSGKTSGPMIDHIRVCENTVPLEVQIDQREYDGRYPSDHFPVVAKIQFNNTSQLTYKGTANQNIAPEIIKPTKPGV
jgi:endonuclease/exonuclease/phosphatase family metal-dependent hydrolase